MTKLKVKTVVGLSLAIVSFYILNCNKTASADPISFSIVEEISQEKIVNADNLLNNYKTNGSVDSLSSEHTVRGNFTLLDEIKDINITNASDILDFSFLDVKNPKLKETDTEYIISGNIDPSKLNSDIETKEEVFIKYYFDKNTKEFIKAEADIDNKMDEEITDSIVSEITAETQLSQDDVNSNLELNTKSKVVIKEQELETTDLKNEISSIIHSLKNIELKEEYRNVNIGDFSYTLGVSKLEYEEEEKDTETNEVIKDDIIYKLDDQDVITGISFNWNNGSYLNSNSQDLLKKELGEPVVVGNSYFWKVTALDNSLIISCTDEYCEVFIVE